MILLGALRIALAAPLFLAFTIALSLSFALCLPVSFQLGIANFIARAIPVGVARGVSAGVSAGIARGIGRESPRTFGTAVAICRCAIATAASVRAIAPCPMTVSAWLRAAACIAIARSASAVAAAKLIVSTGMATAAITRAGRAGSVRRAVSLRIANEPTLDALPQRGYRRGDRWCRRCCRCDDRCCHGCSRFDDRRGGRGQKSRYRSGFRIEFLFARASRVGDHRRRRQLVAQALRLGGLGLVGAQSANRVFRCFDVEIWHDDQIDITFAFEGLQSLPFFIDQVGGDVDRHFGNDLGRVLLARLFANQSHDGQRHGLDRTNTANTLAAGAHAMTRIT